MQYEVRLDELGPIPLATTTALSQEESAGHKKSGRVAQFLTLHPKALRKRHAIEGFAIADEGKLYVSKNLRFLIGLDCLAVKEVGKPKDD